MKPIVRFAIEILQMQERIEHLERENSNLRAENQRLRLEQKQAQSPRLIQKAA